MVALGLKKTPGEYAALRAEKAAAISAASPAAADAVAAPETEPQSVLPASAEPPAAAAEQPAALSALLSLSDEDLNEHCRRTRSYSYDDLKEEYEAGREFGREQAQRERSDRTEDLIGWLQSQLSKACSRIEELDVQLEHQEHVHECLQRELPIECAAWDELPGPVFSFDEQQLELWQLMSRESISDLSVRHRASLARYGK